MTDLARFYKAISDHALDDDGGLDYDWVLKLIEDEDHPKLGPPIPMSMRPSMERILYEVYAPGLRAQINRTSPLLALVRSGKR